MMAPWAKFTIFITPKMIISPAVTMNSMAAVLRMSSNNPIVFSSGRPTGGRHASTQFAAPRQCAWRGRTEPALPVLAAPPFEGNAQRFGVGLTSLEIRTLGAGVHVLEGLQDLDGPVLLHLPQPHGQRGMALAVHLHHPRGPSKDTWLNAATIFCASMPPACSTAALYR